MKTHFVKLGTFVLILTSFISCKDNKQEIVEKRITKIESYVDSLKTLKIEQIGPNWDNIDAAFEKQSSELDSLTNGLPDDKKVEFKGRLNDVMSKYFDIKAIVIKDTVVIEKPVVVKGTNQKLRDRFFGAGVIGEDMNFTWVNKNNILSVYEKFFEAYKANKSLFSREDFDEVKLMYEGLDSRKNTVEKEGLTSEDNGKIASLKLKFATMFKINRIGAKSAENQEAKK